MRYRAVRAANTHAKMRDTPLIRSLRVGADMADALFPKSFVFLYEHTAPGVPLDAAVPAGLTFSRTHVRYLFCSSFRASVCGHTDISYAHNITFECRSNFFLSRANCSAQSPTESNLRQPPTSPRQSVADGRSLAVAKAIACEFQRICRAQIGPDRL
jgi:hypothetical protein